MRHHYISVAVFGIAFGIATAVTILVIGRAMMPQPQVAAAMPVQQPVQVQPALAQLAPMNVDWGHRHWHWHWRWDSHDLSERIRAEVMSEIADAFHDIDVDTDDDDEEAPTPPSPPVTTTVVPVVIRK